MNKLLNEMDGLKEKEDILFILTTNRPEALEAALAARPGRIDQAIDSMVRLQSGEQAGWAISDGRLGQFVESANSDYDAKHQRVR